MPSNDEPNHIKLDRADARIQEFVRSLPLDRAGSILELQGIPPLHVVPIVEELHDTDKLTTALLKRRRESQQSNEDWAAVDREAWDPNDAR